MALTISGTTNVGISLVAGNNPVTVSATGDVGTIASTTPGISGPSSTAWNITNYGVIAGKNDAISLAGAGTVDNAAAILGQIYILGAGIVTNTSLAIVSSSFQNAVYLPGGGKVTNAGALLSTAASSQNGVRIRGNGTVNNLQGGMIEGADGGDVVSGGIGALYNGGYINGITQYGVYFLGGGRIVNQDESADIKGAQDGIKVMGTGGTVVNVGLISGATTAGVALLAGGGVSNQSGGLIVGGTYGILSTSTGSATGVVVNAGVVLGNSSAGVYLQKGGAVINQSGGTISSNHVAAEIGGVAGTIVNAGLLTAATGDGINLLHGGSVTNQSGGTVRSGSYAIYDPAGVAAIVNAGLLAGGTATFAVWLKAGGGSVVNQSGGTIQGGLGGIIVQGAAVSIVNAGVVSGATSAGVGLEIAGSSVTNQSGGSISGGSFGVYADASTPGMVVNEGGISGGATGFGVFGVYFKDGGSVANLSALASIYGGGGGIVIKGAAGTVTNAGTVQAKYRDAVVLQSGGAVTNQTGGTISGIGGASGIFVFGGASGTVVNAGLVTASGQGIYLESPGNVANQSGGTIESGVYAIYTSATATVTNAGVVTGASQYGVWLNGGGAVTNQSGGTIDGGRGGILVLYAAASVVNAGVVSGTTTVGVALELAGSSVTNQSGGSISGGKFGIYANTLTPGIVVNEGSISGGTNGVYFKDGGTVSNLAAFASISGGTHGIRITGSAGTVTNAGMVTGSEYGVELGSNGAVFNQSGGTIVGHTHGIRFDNGSSGTVINAGLVSGADGVVFYTRAATVTNQSGGTITASSGHGIFAYYGGTVLNAGVVAGGTSSSGLYLYGGSATNLGGGTIQGGEGGIIVRGGSGNITNAGVISGAGDYGINLTAGGTVFAQGGGTISGTGAVEFATGHTNELDAYPGASFVGTVNGGNTVGATSISTLNLMAGGTSGDGRGTIAGLGSQFVNFAQTTIVPGAYWVLGGTSTIANGTQLAIDPSGRLDLLSGSFSDAGVVTNDGSVYVGEAGSIASLLGTGGIAVGSGGALTLTGSVAATQQIALYSGAHLTIASSATVGFDRPLLVPASASVVSQATTDTVSGATNQPAIVTLDGIGASWHSAGTLQVGGSAPGSFAVEGSAVATAAAAVIAGTTGAAGSEIEVSGAGSSLSVTGTLTVGNAGSGSLSLSQGASVTASSLDVAAGATGDGSVSLVGAGTTLTVTGALTLGDQAAGELSILGGAQMTIAGGLVGGLGGAGGNLDIEGTGSQLTINGGTLVVGENGPAEFTLGIGATLKGEVATDLFGITNEFGDVDPATDPNDGTLNVGNSQGGSSQEYDFFVANSGTINIKGTATFYTPLVTFETGAQDLSVNGLWVIGAKDTLVMNATSVDASQAFDFASAAGAALVIGRVPGADVTNLDTLDGQTMPTLTGSIAPGAANVLAGWAAPIENYASGDAITLAGLAYGSATASGDVVTMWPGAAGQGTPRGSLTFLDKNGNPSNAQAALAATQINALACFVAGTRIGTDSGLVAVEDLAVGDLVRTVAGGCEPVVWVGSRAVDCARHPRPETVWPVCVTAGAFGENVPGRDLYLSPDHAVYVNEVLVPVKLLVNGSSIKQVKRNHVAYHHVELPEHAVILAEGLAVESYLDTGDRTNFAGGAVRLYPDFGSGLAPIGALVWETKGAAPLVMAGEKLETVRTSIVQSASRHGGRFDRAASGVD